MKKKPTHQFGILKLRGTAHVETIRHYELRLGSAQIWALLKAAGAVPDKDVRNVSITFAVPSSGDYSGDDVELSGAPADDRVVTVRWVTADEAKP